MCVSSMVMDHYRDMFREREKQIQPFSNPIQINLEPRITDEEIREFRKLLDRAREYDKKHNEPDCEIESKRNEIRELAKKLGVDVSFIDEVPK